VADVLVAVHADPVALRDDLSVGWSVDTHDWRGDRAEAMLAATSQDLCDGAIVLAHDGIGPGARRDDVGETVRYVELVAQCAAQRGFTLAAMS
jgi:peptidoglycan/xylan/chitin deacetylase (PgdA/CDA1 family)